MAIFKNLFILLGWLFVLTYFCSLNSVLAKVVPRNVKPDNKFANTTLTIPIGVVIDNGMNLSVFESAMLKYTDPNLAGSTHLEAFVHVINTQDSYKLSRLVCDQISRGVLGILAVVHPLSIGVLQYSANAFQLPIVSSFTSGSAFTKPPDDISEEFMLSIIPDYHEAIVKTIIYYGWTNVIYFYDTRDGTDKLSLFYNAINPNKGLFGVSIAKEINSAKDVIIYLRQLEKRDRWSNKYVILDCNLKIAKEVIKNHVRDLQLGRENYHYLFGRLILDSGWEYEMREYNSINITGFKLIDPKRRFVQDYFNTTNATIEAKDALMHDAIHTIGEAFQRIAISEPGIIQTLLKANNQFRFLECRSNITIPLKYGKEMLEYIKQTKVEGFSGKIRFSPSGLRKNVSLSVVQNTPGVNYKMKEIAVWYAEKGFRPIIKQHRLDIFGTHNANKAYTVVLINEPPYFQSSKPVKLFDDDPEIIYSGLCVELAELIADKLGIQIQFRPSSEGKYGGINKHVPGGWDGIIGQLLREEIDMAVAPVRVTKEREAVVEFSIPFLSLKEIPKPEKKSEKSWFVFLNPFSTNVWYLVGISALLTCVFMYVVTRLSSKRSPNQAVTNTAQTIDENIEAPVATPIVVHQNNFIDSIWSIIGFGKKMGNGIAPRSVSAKMVVTIWRVFVVYLVITYSAYMATQQIFAHGRSPTQVGYNRIAQCPEDLQPKIRKQLTVDNEPHANGDSLSEIEDEYAVPGNCDMLISAMDPDTINFAIAFPKGSELRSAVNQALISIRKEGSLQMLIRRYFYKVNGGAPLLPKVGKELTLNDMAGLFFILIGFLALSLLVSAAEYLHYRCSKGTAANSAGHELNEIHVPQRRALRRRHSEDLESGNDPGPGPSGACNRSSMQTGHPSIPYPDRHTICLSYTSSESETETPPKRVRFEDTRKQ